MRKILSGIFLSLDGVMQSPGGPEEDPTGGFTQGGWLTSFWDDATDAAIGSLFEGDFDLLLGRKTYEIFAAHWPYVSDDDPIGQSFNRAAKYVVTASREPLSWVNSHAIHGDIGAELAKLKASDGPDLIIQGSSALYPLLLREGLIDRFYLMTFPVVLGHGKRAFAEATPPGALRLVEHAVSPSGVVIATYEPAGEIPPGNFQLAEPTVAEVARRERMRREG